MTKKPKPRLNRWTCPTCGHGPAYLRTRKGGRTYMKDRSALTTGVGGRFRRRNRGEPTDVMRVYWPQRSLGRGTYRKCPDPWHNRFEVGAPKLPWRWDPAKGTVVDLPATNVNLHDPDKAQAKTRRRAVRHRDRQSKTRR